MELLLRDISKPFEVKKKISDMQSAATQHLRQSMMHQTNNQIAQEHNMHHNQVHPQHQTMQNNPAHHIRR
jgi:protein-tyrosine-phosphatase